MRSNPRIWSGVGLTVLLLLGLGAFERSRAGGPLLVTTATGQPVIWSKVPVRGGRLNSTTVDEQGRVIYHVDMGTLGPVSHDMAVKLVDRIFGEYNSIETSTIRFVNGGPILDPNTGQPVDVTSSNYGQFSTTASRTYQNPIVFDSDGGITGRGGVLGFVFPLNTSGGTMREGVVVLNGSTVNSVGGIVPFLGVFTHEFGHFAGPLDHSQVNGRIASRGTGADLPEGFSTNQLFDLFAPFTETLYPFIFSSPTLTSDLARQGLRSSGYFTATIDLDMKVAMSNLYPAPGYLASEPSAQTGSITGQVIARAFNIELTISGLNIVARRISRGTFPPPLGTVAYPAGLIPKDDDGVPLTPPDQDATDPLATAISVVSGLIGDSGSFRFNGLPPGDYMIYAEGINPGARGGSGIGQYDPPLNLPIPERYNGANESNDPAVDDPKSFAPVPVQSASTTAGVQFVLNGFGGAVPPSTEVEPNETLVQAQKVPSQVSITGTIAKDDPRTVTLNLGGDIVGIHDLYRVELTAAANLLVSLRAGGANADIDLYLFNGTLREGQNSSNGGSLVNLSNGETGEELIITNRLIPGVYYVGISGYSASTPYSLVMLDSTQSVKPTAAVRSMDRQTITVASVVERVRTNRLPALFDSSMIIARIYAGIWGL